jgi:hypothetical protein
MLFGKKYKDDELVLTAEHALNDDPTIGISRLRIFSEKGVVTLRGEITNGVTKQHVEEVVHKGLERSGLKYQKVVDELVKP